MIIEINASILIGFMLGALFWFPLGAIIFAILIYFPDIKSFWSSLKFIYKYLREKK